MSRIRWKPCFLLIAFLFFTITASAQSDDITLAGSKAPLFVLDHSVSHTVITSADEHVTMIIDNVIVEKDRILLRFYISDLPETWKTRINDDARIYGSYLPLAEVVLDSGEFLTPSSASKYSFLEFNNKCIIGGLLIFYTDKQPQAFFINFNQIPFDTQPLSEGFSYAVILNEYPEGNAPSEPLSTEENNKLEFTLTATAQTDEMTMLQPAVRMFRQDEILSKFGWITVSDKASGKIYAVTRGNLYGFNLTDDSVYSPAHSYIFSSLHNGSPLEISMDHAYVIRSFESPHQVILDLSGENRSVLLSDADFSLTVSGVQIIEEKDCIRIYIDSGPVQISDISFSFKNVSDVIKPSVMCGSDTEKDRFACDLFFNDISFPKGMLAFGIDAVEYRLDGPWSVTWTPVMMESRTEITDQGAAQDLVYNYRDPISKEQPDEVLSVLSSLEQKNIVLSAEPGWIHEAYEYDYQFGSTVYRDLIPADQAEQYYTHYISENWYHIGNDSRVFEILNVVRDTDRNEIRSAILKRPGITLDLVHALLAYSNQPLDPSFQCFTVFTDLARSSAVFVSEGPCPDTDNSKKCLTFYQSLNGLPDSPNRQDIIFQIDNETNYIESYSISYDFDALKLVNKTLILEKTGSLPDDLAALFKSIIL